MSGELNPNLLCVAMITGFVFGLIFQDVLFGILVSIIAFNTYHWIYDWSCESRQKKS